MKKGFTLTEVVVAIIIFAIGVLGIFSFFIYASQITRLARQTTIASNFAQGILEENFSLSYDELNPGIGARERISSDPDDPFYHLEKQVNITLIDSDLASSASDIGLKKIDVFVYWQERVNEKNVQLTTIKTKR